MYLIVGLGNPEEKYSKTRHNMGFDVINKLAGKYDIQVTKNKFEGLYGTGTIEGERIVLLKPQTYMNLSGNSVVKFMNFYKLDLKDIIIIYDDFDIEEGTIRIRKNGSAGTHNGMKSVIGALGSEEFVRIRIGIGDKEDSNAIEHVISKLLDEEYKILLKGIDKGIEAVIEILKNGIDSSMNHYNWKRDRWKR